MIAEIVVADVFFGFMDIFNVPLDCVPLFTVREVRRVAITQKIPNFIFVTEIFQEGIVGPLG